MKKIAVAAVALAAMTGSALAADIYVPPVAPPAPPPAPVFSWAGSYAGVYAGVVVPPGSPFYFGGFTIGHNFVSGSLVYGLEAQLGAINLGGGAVFGAELNGRVGVAVGATDRALIYGEAGITRLAGLPFTILTAGGGIEFAINDRISLYGEAKAIIIPAGPGFIGTAIRGGVNFHF